MRSRHSSGDRAFASIGPGCRGHPWPANPGWYNKLAVRPLIGELFLRTCVYPLGLLLANGSSRSVFEPQTVPENYVRRAAILMVLRPKNFYSNALDLVFLERF